jgi:hypothetical protein
MTGRIPIPNRVQAFSDWYGDGGCAPYERMQKIDERVSYREATDAENAAKTNCYNCRYYGWGDCNLVEGTVEASWLCDLFTKQPEFYLMELYDVAGGNHAVRLNVEQLRFKAADGTVTAPEWIQYWPAPGRLTATTIWRSVARWDSSTICGSPRTAASRRIATGMKPGSS